MVEKATRNLAQESNQTRERRDRVNTSSNAHSRNLTLTDNPEYGSEQR